VDKLVEGGDYDQSKWWACMKMSYGNPFCTINKKKIYFMVCLLYHNKIELWRKF
jgi:hypothetical protein